MWLTYLTVLCILSSFKPLVTFNCFNRKWKSTMLCVRVCIFICCAFRCLQIPTTNYFNLNFSLLSKCQSLLLWFWATNSWSTKMITLVYTRTRCVLVETRLCCTKVNMLCSRPFSYRSLTSTRSQPVRQLSVSVGARSRAAGESLSKVGLQSFSG